MESQGRSRKFKEGHGEKLWVGCVACWIIVSGPVPDPFLWTLDFGFRTWIWDLDMGPGFGTWVWDWTRASQF